jgi:NADPH2:quinone reductase
MPDPTAGPGQVVVDVAIAPMLYIDTQIRAGAATQWFPMRPPYIPGVGVAGTVSAIGPGVSPNWLGLRVLSDCTGGYVERVAVPADGLIPVLPGVELTDAAALLHDGRTALKLADTAALKSGESVLITAAAGGLGLLLVQLAHAAGARVVGAARGTHKLDLAAAAGADEVVDYSAPGWPDRITGSIDVVFDGVGSDIGAAAFDRIADGGRFFAYGAPSGGAAAIDPAAADNRNVTVHGIDLVQLQPDEGHRLARRALDEAAAGRLRPRIGGTFPLADAAGAHAAIEAREIPGKALLLI